MLLFQLLLGECRWTKLASCRLWTAAISVQGIRWASLARVPLFMAESWSFLWWILPSRGWSRFPQGAPVARRWLPHSTWSQSSHFSAFDSVAEWARDAIFDRTQSRLSRWCQAETLCMKCGANLVNSQHKSLQVSHTYGWPTVQIQASRILLQECNFLFFSQLTLIWQEMSKKEDPGHLHLVWIS